MGASASAVVRMVLKETLEVSLLGVVGGVGAAYLLSRFLRSLLFGVSPHDAAAYIAAPLILLLATLFAAAIPGFRAARTDPALTLRQD